MKLSVIYDSKTDNTKTVAGYIVNGMEQVPGIEAMAFSITDVDTDFVKESVGVVFGSPTYCAGPTADFYKWMEQDAKVLGLAGKLGGVFATGRFIHGGEDINMMTIISHMLVRGMMVYSGGGAFGDPVIHVGPVEISPDAEDFRELFEIYGKRFAGQAVKTFG
ncbi:MAG: flavodoxin family protein [Lachnospiraceae bacterium]|nr:flavodoxin family protein [Lachnospiraceae bacterium]